MKLLLVISCAFALAAADVSLQLKQGGFDAAGFDGGASYDTYDLGPTSDGGHEEVRYESYSSGGSSYTADAGASTGGSSDGGSGATRFGSFSSGGGSSFASGGGSSSGGDAGFSAGSGQLETGRSGFLDYSSGGSSSGSGGKIVKPIIKHGEPLVSKAFYVHEAPAEEVRQEVGVETKETVVRPRKHYNIVFVKTPVAGGGSVAGGSNVNVFPENEEKTIIYVLNGRADGLQVNSNGEVELPKPKSPSKPEVVFVKYNNEADAQRAISDIQSQYNSQKGATVSVIGSGASSGGGSSGYGGTRSGVSTGGSSSATSGSSHSTGSTSFTSQTESKPIRSVRYRRDPSPGLKAATAFQIQKSRELTARKY